MDKTKTTKEINSFYAVLLKHTFFNLSHGMHNGVLLKCFLITFMSSSTACFLVYVVWFEKLWFNG